MAHWSGQECAFRADPRSGWTARRQAAKAPRLVPGESFNALYAATRQNTQPLSTGAVRLTEVSPLPVAAASSTPPRRLVPKPAQGGMGWQRN